MTSGVAGRSRPATPRARALAAIAVAVAFVWTPLSGAAGMPPASAAIDAMPSTPAQAVGLVPDVAVALPLLPPEAIVRAAILGHPDVAAASALFAADRAVRDRLVAGEHEFAVELGGQRRTGADHAHAEHDWSAALVRPLRLPRKRDLDIGIGDRQVARGGIAVADARHEVSRALLAAWFDALRRQAASAQAQRQLALAARTLDVVERRLRAGDAARLEQLQASAALRSADGLARAAAREAAVARERLVRAWPGLEGLALPDPQSPDAVPVMPAGSAGTWREAIVAQHHEVRLRQAEVELRAARAERAGAGRVPDPGIGIRGATDRGGREQVLGVFVTVPWPGAARAASEREAVAQVDEARARLAATERRVLAEAAASWTVAVEGVAAWSALADAYRASEAAAVLAARAFELGEGSLADLLFARRLALEAAGAETAARLDAIEAHARLRIDAHALWDFDD